MNLKPLLLAAVTIISLTACKSTYDKGPYLPQNSKTPPHENTERVVLMDPGVQYSLTCTGVQEGASTDGRLEVVAQIRNRENRRIEVQVNCVFKDANGYTTGDETPFQTLILTENATEQVKFTAMNTLAKKYTIRIRQAR
jgi:predicted small lipoprotein YifL